MAASRGVAVAATSPGKAKRIALLAAGIGAVGATAARSETTLDLKVLGYQENDGRTRVIDPVLYYDQDFGEKGRLGILAAFDSISGASPTGQAPALNTTTSASGGTVTSGEFPKASYRDTRTALALSYGRRSGSHVPTVSLSYSKEADYLSQGVSLVDAWDFAGGRSTLHFGGGVNWDRIEPTINNAVLDKRGVSLSLGLTRVLGVRDLLDLSLGREILKGYLTDPYKVVSVGTSVLNEVRPSDRARWSLVARHGHYFSWRGALKTSYRYYWDDWRIRAHTLELTYDQRIGQRWILTPRLRYYTQGAASFFAYDFPSARPAMSADYRLSSFWSWLGGVGVSCELNRGFGLNLALAYERQTGLDRLHPPPVVRPPIAGRRALTEEAGEDGSGGSGGLSAADMKVFTATAGFTLKF